MLTALKAICREHGDDDPLESDIAFHVAVLQASRNRFYAQLTGFTSTALRFSIRMTNRYKGVRLASVAVHKKVSDAILAGKPAAAGDSSKPPVAVARIPLPEAAPADDGGRPSGGNDGNEFGGSAVAQKSGQVHRQAGAGKNNINFFSVCFSVLKFKPL